MHSFQFRTFKVVYFSSISPLVLFGKVIFSFRVLKLMKFLTYCSYQYFSRFFSTGMVKIEHLEGICSLGCMSITKAILPPRVVKEDWGLSQKFSDQLYLKLTLQKTRYICLHLCMCVYTYTHTG